MKKLVLSLLVMVFCSQLSFAQSKETMVLISTKYGEMKVKLYNETPKHRDNFIKLANEGLLNGTIFHRVIENFMIQGGDPDSKNAKPDQMLGNGGPGYNITAEINPKFYHKKGALAAARLGDQVNPKKESSGSQFYIVQGQAYDNATLDQFEQRMGKKFSAEQRKSYSTIGGTPHLDGAYTVFGEVVQGMDVIDKIAKVKKGSNDRPAEDIVMSVKVIK